MIGAIPRNSRSSTSEFRPRATSKLRSSRHVRPDHQRRSSLEMGASPASASSRFSTSDNGPEPSHHPSGYRCQTPDWRFAETPYNAGVNEKGNGPPLELSPNDMRRLGYRVVDLLVQHVAGMRDGPVGVKGAP